MISGNPNYTQKQDIPLAASFVSDREGLTVWLEPREIVKHPNGQETTVLMSGLKIKFEEGELSVSNSAVLEKMLRSDKFNKSYMGFRPNPEDPTGFWREYGLIQTNTIQVVDPTQPILADKDADDRWKFISAKLKTMKKPEDLPNIRAVRFV